MAEISSYPKIQPKEQDLIVGTETYVAGIAEVTGNPTRNFTVGSLVELVNSSVQRVTSLTTVGTSGVSTLTTEGVLNIPNYANTQYTLTTTGSSGTPASLSGTVINVPTPVIPFTSLTTTGVSGTAAALSSGVLNIPTPVVPFTSLTTNGTSGAATLSSGVLNIPTPSSSAAAPLEFNAGMTQTGTGAPNPTAAKQINTLEVSGSAYRFLNFTRVSTGTYNIEIIYENTLQPTDSSKVSVFLGFGNCRIIAKTNINSGTQSTIRYTFETYTPAGVLADGQMTGANGGFLNIKLYS